MSKEAEEARNLERSVSVRIKTPPKVSLSELTPGELGRTRRRSNSDTPPVSPLIIHSSQPSNPLTRSAEVPDGTIIDGSKTLPSKARKKIEKELKKKEKEERKKEAKTMGRKASKKAKKHLDKEKEKHTPNTSTSSHKKEKNKEKHKGDSSDEDESEMTATNLPSSIAVDESFSAATVTGSTLGYSAPEDALGGSVLTGAGSAAMQQRKELREATIAKMQQRCLAAEKRREARREWRYAIKRRRQLCETIFYLILFTAIIITVEYKLRVHHII